MEINNLMYFEKRIQLEIEEINTRIRDLTLEKLALQRQLVKAKSANSGVKSETRKNSINRVMVESKILGELSQSKKPVSARLLYKVAQLANFELKETTFRTYLHRMKKRGLIQSVGNNGTWRIT